jgi:phage host-nuclease inhibitor protein Gam
MSDLELTMMRRVGELNKENARLKAEVERLTAFTTRTIIPNEELQAQVERLTKAGDAMLLALNKRDDFFDNSDKVKGISDWNAAKEGKQS